MIAPCARSQARAEDMSFRHWVQVGTTTLSLAVSPAACLAEQPAGSATEEPVGETSTEMSRDEWKMRIEEARRRIAAERRERRLGLRAPAEQDLAKIAAERALERALNDTTLEPGDIVSTSKGFLVFKRRTGPEGERNEFVPLIPR